MGSRRTDRDDSGSGHDLDLFTGMLGRKLRSRGRGYLAIFIAAVVAEVLALILLLTMLVG